MSRHCCIPAWVLFMLLVLAPACKKQKSIAGKDFVERDVFVDVLVDIHLADGVSNDRKFNRKYDADSIDMLSPILEKHHITREMFDTTLVEYSKYPELFDQVYNDVLIRLNVMLEENDLKDPPPGY